MENDEYVKVALRYGRTNGLNIPYMTENKLFVVGYNSIYGLLNVHEDKGKPYFEGRVNIETLLSELKSKHKEVDSGVEDFIMKSYNNLLDYNRNHKKYGNVPPKPIMSVRIGDEYKIKIPKYQKPKFGEFFKETQKK